MISLSVPGVLLYRDVAVRVVGSAAKILGPAGALGRASAPDLGDEFASQVVSAFGEAFNNLAIHGYRDVPSGRIDLEITGSRDESGGELVVRIRDTGRVFDPRSHLEVPDAEPERGMGLFIIRNFIDEIGYESGPPNVLTLRKRFSAPG